jgi:hypothetical protein
MVTVRTHPEATEKSVAVEPEVAEVGETEQPDTS